MKLSLALLAILAACGGSSGGNPADSNGGGSDGSNNGSADAQIFMDAPQNVPAMITISGQANERTANGASPVQGAIVGAYKSSNEATPVAMATTDAMGNFSITVMTNNMPLDGFLKATK